MSLDPVRDRLSISPKNATGGATPLSSGSLGCEDEAEHSAPKFDPNILSLSRIWQERKLLPNQDKGDLKMFMKNVCRVATLGTAAVVATLVCAFPTNANAHQAAGQSEVRFAFRVGNTYMPPGHYVLQEKSADGLLYSLKHSQTGKSVMVLCPVSDDSRPNRLIFGKDETGYVLTRVR